MPQDKNLDQAKNAKNHQPKMRSYINITDRVQKNRNATIYTLKPYPNDSKPNPTYAHVLYLIVYKSNHRYITIYDFIIYKLVICSIYNHTER